MRTQSRQTLISQLIRKIGYSVGLEFVVSRTLVLTKFYAEHGRISYSEWRELVYEEFGRKREERKSDSKSAPEHIGDFFNSLDLFSLRGRELIPMYWLEVTSIVYRWLKDSGSADLIEGALRYLLTIKLLEQDGDVFLNCLAADFKKAEAKHRLEALIEYKRSQISRVIRNRSALEEVYTYLTIKQQGLDSASGRQPSRGLKGAGSKPSPKVEVSDGYLRHVLSTRKGWARDLGLLESSACGRAGATLLNCIEPIGLITNDGIYAFWPYEDVLEKLRIPAESISAPRLSQWDLLSTVSASLGWHFSHHSNCAQDNSNENDELEASVDLLREIYNYYRAGNKAKASIRHQLPLYVALPAYAAIATVRGKEIPNLPDLIDAEGKGDKRRFDVANIRGTAGALMFRKDSR